MLESEVVGRLVALTAGGEVIGPLSLESLELPAEDVKMPDFTEWGGTVEFEFQPTRELIELLMGLRRPTRAWVHGRFERARSLHWRRRGRA